jgi:mono/diheme cytochrome c family protein
MLARGDPVATEPTKYVEVPIPFLELTDTEVASLSAFLETRAEGAPSQQTVQAPEGEEVTRAEALQAGDPVVGRSLFTGATRLSNGGPSCRACHSIAGIGGLGGGKLGPDLTGAYKKYEENLITLWPESRPPMVAIYSSKPLTEEEKTDLLAFFESADVTQRPTEVIGQLVGLSLAGMVGLMGFAHLVWRRRLTKVRRPMVTGQKSHDS